MGKATTKTRRPGKKKVEKALGPPLDARGFPVDAGSGGEGAGTEHPVPGSRRVGRQTVVFPGAPHIASAAAVGGTMEREGPVGAYLDRAYEDPLIGKNSWEKAERQMLFDAVELACEKMALTPADVDLLFAGDLLNQIISANFAARDLDVPFIGIFGACSAMTEAIGLAAMAVDGGYARRAAAAVASHHHTAERQYRFPTEFANQRPPSAQWTATGGAAFIIQAAEPEMAGMTGGTGGGPTEDGGGDWPPGPGHPAMPGQPRITHATFGRVMDLGVKDPFNLGAAMAPAAADTIRRHLSDTERSPDYYDLILTGDLASVGTSLCIELLYEQGIDVAPVFDDCGMRLYERDHRVNAGASGAAASGIVMAGQIFRRLKEGRLRRVLLVATGALLSKTSAQQGESIPAVAHAVAVESSLGPGGGRR